MRNVSSSGERDVGLTMSAPNGEAFLADAVRGLSGTSKGEMVPHQLTLMMSYLEIGPLLKSADYTITAYRFDLPIDPKVFKK